MNREKLLICHSALWMHRKRWRFRMNQLALVFRDDHSDIWDVFLFMYLVFQSCCLQRPSNEKTFSKEAKENDDKDVWELSFSFTPCILDHFVASFFVPCTSFLSSIGSRWTSFISTMCNFVHFFYRRNYQLSDERNDGKSQSRWFYFELYLHLHCCKGRAIESL